MWVPAAVDEAGAAQLARGLAVYLAQPGYGEMFAAAGFADVVAEARSGRHPRDLAPPPELVELVGAVGAPAQVRTRILEFGEAGADVVCLAPATAADPGAGRLLHEVVGQRGPESPSFRGRVPSPAAHSPGEREVRSVVSGPPEGGEGDGRGVTHVQRVDLGSERDPDPLVGRGHRRVAQAGALRAQQHGDALAGLDVHGTAAVGRRAPG